MSRSYTSSPPSAFMACSGIALALGHAFEKETPVNNIRLYQWKHIKPEFIFLNKISIYIVYP
jgi:hypothetical protein